MAKNTKDMKNFLFILLVPSISLIHLYLLLVMYVDEPVRAKSNSHVEKVFMNEPHLVENGTTTGNIIQTSPTFEHLMFHIGSGTADINLQTGKVTIENITLDEAALGFWNAIESRLNYKITNDTSRKSLAQP